MELIGECKGNNGNGCFMDSCGHDCGCFTIQERSYSEEEVLVLLQDIQAQVGIDYNDNFMFADKWFEQNKKK